MMRTTTLALCAAASAVLVGAACPGSIRSVEAGQPAPAAVVDATDHPYGGSAPTRLAADETGKRHAPGMGAEDTRGEPPDNTGVNKRDRGGDTLTPMDQSENAADRTVTQKIRRAIVDDKSLSTDAHNVKIITVDGVVTLRGPVKSDQERSAVVAKANKVPGVKKLNDQLDVAGK
jgi:hypothetical protein